MKIGLDFDGVIADCGKLKREGALRLFGVDIPEHKFKKEIVFAEGLLTPEQYRDLQVQIFDTPEIGLLATPVEGMREYISQLALENHRLAVITSRFGASLAIAREWLAAHNLDLEVIGVGTDISKAAICRELGLDVFVDDDLDKLEDVLTVPHRFLFSWGYNKRSNEQGIAIRVFSWRDLYEKIKALSI